jgi:hypothetical protein
MLYAMHVVKCLLNAYKLLCIYSNFIWFYKLKRNLYHNNEKTQNDRIQILFFIVFYHLTNTVL